jgi:hypothetical protein
MALFTFEYEYWAKHTRTYVYQARKFNMYLLYIDDLCCYNNIAFKIISRNELALKETTEPPTDSFWICFGHR